MAYQILEFPQTNELMEVSMQMETLKVNSELNGNQPDQNFCQDDNDIPKKKKKKSKTFYSPTKIKARNYLSNISYRRVSDKDFVHAGFIIDMLTYIVMDLKLFFLNTAYSEEENRDMIKMLWEKYLPKRFYDHVKLPENFQLLNSGKINFKQAKGIVHSYVQLPDVWQEMLKYVKDHHSNYQYVYSLLFPKNYLQTNKRGIKHRNNFALCFTEWENEELAQQRGKNPFNFNVPNVERHPYEQKPIKDDFKIEQMLHPIKKPKFSKPRNDDKFRADVVDSSNKENIPPLAYSNERYKFALSKPNLKTQEKIEARNKKKRN